jgi:hypothetical protein
MVNMKILKSGLVLLLTIPAIAGCGEREEAKQRLEEAKTMYENKAFAAAKNLIDTINLRYPHEIEIRKEALTLMRLVERGECERNIAYCDSVLPICLEEAEVLKKGFVFEKDTAYDDIGKYVRKTMTIERNVERSYIRCGVNEEGEMYIASVYFGSNPIHHTGLKFSINDGTFAETPSIPYDGGVNYRFKDMDNTTEVVTYKGENCKTSANFVFVTDEKERIKAEYTGGKPFSLYLSDNDKKDIKATCKLAMLLSEINAMQKEKIRSEKKIKRIDEKLNKQEGTGKRKSAATRNTRSFSKRTQVNSTNECNRLSNRQVNKNKRTYFVFLSACTIFVASEKKWSYGTTGRYIQKNSITL